MSKINDTDYLTPPEIDQLLNVSRMTTLKWIREKKLPAINVGNGKRAHYRVHRKDFEEFVEQLKTTAKK